MHCGWHSCCWESGAHALPIYAAPPWPGGHYYRRRRSREEEREELRDYLADLKAEIEEIEGRLAALEK